MSTGTRRSLVIFEVLICFVPLACYVAFALISLPLGLLLLIMPPYVGILLGCMLGGLIGVIGLLGLCTQVLRSDAPDVERTLGFILLCAVGLSTFAAAMTGGFQFMDLDLSTTWLLLAPTLCVTHLAFIAFRRTIRQRTPARTGRRNRRRSMRPNRARVRSLSVLLDAHS